jgi:GAF domain-containing protein
MKRRSRAGREIKGRRHKTPEPGRGNGRKAVHSISSTAGKETKVARLTRERDEALEQQTATSEVLQVINGSAGDPQPVFEAILAKAVRICDAHFGNIHRWDGNAFYLVATHNTPPALAEARRRSPLVASPQTAQGRLVVTKTAVHITDLAADSNYVEARDPTYVTAVELGGVRTLMLVPMLREGALLGSFAVYRQEVRPFTDKQIALVTNFAAQAVIAIENARLLNELRQRTTDLTERTADLTEALDQQTATSEVLQVISSSPGDLKPVFASMLKNAIRICDATFGNIYRWDGEALHLVATHNTPPAFAEARRRAPHRRDDKNQIVTSIFATRTPVHIGDAAAQPGYIDRSDLAAVQSVELGGVRTLLAVPMLKESELIRSFSLYRQEIRPFTDKQIALVTNFAAQAIIAIENARLLNELRQSLEQQTATSQVLQVISSSPGELEPVFRAMLENATRICEAKYGVLYRYDGQHFSLATHIGAGSRLVEFMKRGPITPHSSTILGRMVGSKEVIEIEDARKEHGYLERHPVWVAGVEQDGALSLLGVPMLKENALVGAFVIFRQEVKLFTDKQIGLVKNFAAQAVIAIENARLLNELRQRTDDLGQRTTDLTEALERQTATSEVLQVISRSAGDLEPVFASMLENAVRICDAKFAIMNFPEPGGVRPVAMHNVPEAFAELQGRVVHFGPKHPLTRVAATKEVMHIPDLELYGDEDAVIAKFRELTGARTILHVPMLKDEELVGIVSIYRQEVRPFTDKQVDLVKNFAAQAVIAIENARLLNELRQRTTDLTEALEQQTATSEVLKVISGSPSDLQPVFAAMLDNATRICQASLGTMTLCENGGFRHVALHGAPAAYAELRAREPIVVPKPAQGLGRLAATKRVVHISDIFSEPPEARGGLAEVAGARTLLIVPMLKEQHLVGSFGIYRQEMRPFTDKQIELVENFAAQAVIAIENARLLNELRQSLEQQTATSDVLQVISSSPGELQPVFKAMLENATRICDAKFGVLHLSEDDGFRAVALHNAPPAFADYVRGGLVRPGPKVPLSRMARTKQVVHVADITTEEAYIERDPLAVAGADLGGYRTILAVPMLKESELIGGFVIFRQEVRLFTDKQIELVQNFAAQAVIAIENARLPNELRQRTADLTERTGDLTEALEQQTATSEVLQVISSSPGDLQPVFATMLEKAVRICDATFGDVYRPHGDAIQLVAMQNTPPAFAEALKQTPHYRPSSSVGARMVATKSVVQVTDLAADQDYVERRSPFITAAVELGGVRTVLAVPMVKESELIGAFLLCRQEVRPFTDKQIELVKNFAAQAVIAIENARLLSELRERTEDVVKLNQHLEQRVTDQVGEIERMGRLRRFLPPQVADLIVASSRDNRALLRSARLHRVHRKRRRGRRDRTATRIPRCCGRVHHQVQRHARALRW